MSKISPDGKFLQNVKDFLQFLVEHYENDTELTNYLSQLQNMLDMFGGKMIIENFILAVDKREEGKLTLREEFNQGNYWGVFQKYTPQIVIVGNLEGKLDPNNFDTDEKSILNEYLASFFKIADDYAKDHPPPYTPFDFSSLNPLSSLSSFFTSS